MKVARSRAGLAVSQIVRETRDMEACRPQAHDGAPALRQQGHSKKPSLAMSTTNSLSFLRTSLSKSKPMHVFHFSSSCLFTRAITGNQKSYLSIFNLFVLMIGVFTQLGYVI
ncbi:hypothetical protein M758_6G044200 [Ceratodon purpureus]|nr:hypothetical protein M758_6G044200 [Ceratodon purpureus]